MKLHKHIFFIAQAIVLVAGARTLHGAAGNIPTKPFIDAFIEKLVLYVHVRNPRAFASKPLSLVDGTPQAGIQQRVALLRDISEMQWGKKNKQGKIVRKFLRLQGKPVTLKELLEIEATASDEQREAFKVSIEDAIKYFERIYAPYWEKAQRLKPILAQVIRDWAKEQRVHEQEKEHTETTLLESWGNQPAGTERLFFREKIVSFKALDEFLEELKLFLVDFILSCPLSLLEYEKALATRQAKELDF